MNRAVRTASEDIVEANIKSSIGMRSKDSPRLANDISGSSILIANSITNLSKSISKTPPIHPPSNTYMNVNHHAIALIPIHRRRHHHQRILSNKVTNASLLFRALRLRNQIELERVRHADQEEEATDVLQQRAGSGHFRGEGPRARVLSWFAKGKGGRGGLES